MARTVAVNLAITGVQAVVAGFTEVGAASKSTASQLEAHSASAKKLGSAMVTMGAVAAGGMALAVRAAMDWDTEWTQVAKHTTGTTAQLDALQSSLRDMAKEIPSSAKDIAAVAQSVVELGVAAPQAAEFTRVMIELGDTTDLVATDAATSLAKFMNVMGTASGDVGRLGSTIVALADSSASTGSGIVDMSLKIAGVANAIGFTTSQTLSFASALTSMGSSMGTVVAQALQKMDAAVRAGGDGLDALAATSGMTSAEFTQAWGTDAAGATAAFVQGLGKIQSSGGTVDDVLSRLKISAGKQSDALRRLAADSDLLSNSLTTGENAWSSNTALVTEATKQYDTAESRITIAWNKINDAAITAGGKILPMVAGLADSAGKLGDTLGSIPGPVLSLITSLGAGVAVIGLAGGGLLKLGVAGAGAYKAFKDMSGPDGFPRATSAMSAVGKAAGVAALALVAMDAAIAVINATGPGDYGNLNDAAEAMGKLSASSTLATAGVNEFFQNSNGVWQGFGSTDLVTGVNNLETAFARLSKPGFLDQINNVGQPIFSALSNGGAKTDIAQITDQFKKLDSGLAAMGSNGGADQAAAAFKKVAAAAKDMDPSQLIALFPEYAAQITAAGTAAGYTVFTSDELAKAMQGELPAGMTATQKAAFTMKAATDAAAFSMDDLVKSMFATADAALKTSGTQIGFEAAIDDATKAAKENGKTLDINTEKGRANRTALDQQATATLAYVSQLTATGAETSVVVAAMQRGRDSFIANQIAMGATAAQAAALADSYGLIPGDVKINLTTPGASEARQSVEDLLASIKKLPPVTQAFIQSVLNTQGIDAAYAAMKALQGTQATVFIKTSYIAANKPILQADGGILKSYAQGGMENHVAQIAPAGAWRVWAEPETGGESYIPLAQEKWPRSREIWWETGKHLGMVAHADGALYSGATTTSVPNVTVGSPMANVQVLLDGRELRHEMRVTYSQESATLATAQRRNRK